MFDLKHYPENWEFRPANSNLRSPLQGVGTNDAPYATQPQINGKQIWCPFYQKWMDMLKRAYSAKCHDKHPTYVGCSVAEEWHSFMNFRTWFEKELNKTDLSIGEACLDKDLLSDSKVYSPSTCLLVPQWLNNLTTARGAARGEWPVGVCLRKDMGKFRSRLRVKGVLKHLGYFTTPVAASNAYKAAKLEHVKTIALPKHLPQRRVRKRLIEIVENQK